MHAIAARALKSAGIALPPGHLLVLYLNINFGVLTKIACPSVNHVKQDIERVTLGKRTFLQVK